MTEEHLSNNAHDAATPTTVMPNGSDYNAAALEIRQKLNAIVRDTESLETAANYLLEELIDDAVFGVFLEIHHLRKTGNLVALDGVPEDANCDEDACALTDVNPAASSANVTSVGNALLLGPSVNTCAATLAPSNVLPATNSSLRIVDLPNYDIFGISTAKKPMECTCPNCERLVSAARFAPHLEKCMGMGRLSSRIASRRLATKDVNSGSSSSTNIGAMSVGTCGTANAIIAGSSPYVQLQSAAVTDDEDDVDWSSSEKRRKKNNNNSRNNGTKKNNGKTSF